MALFRRKQAELPWFGPRDIQALTQEHPEQSGLVAIFPSGRWFPALTEALATVAARYPDRMWAARLDEDMFPKLIEDYTKKKGMDRKEFVDALPAVGVIRDGELFTMMTPSEVFARGRAYVETLKVQVEAFARKFIVDYTPKPKEQCEKKAGMPKAEVNRDKPVAVKVTVGGKASSLTLYEGENLLDAANERGAGIDYSCKQGKCDTCTVTVLKGMENLSEPTEGEKTVLGEQIQQQGKRLACQVIVKGPVEVRQ